MATQAQIAKSLRSRKNPKFSTRIVRRCWKCGRKGGYMRDFNLCRICFRELASKGEIPGIVKASW
jgi:small subunit ribosomal protein S14